MMLGDDAGGVMILSRGKLLAHKFTSETARAEMITIVIQLGGENILISTIYAPPLTKAWEKEEHERKLRDTLQDMNRVIKKASQKNHRLIMVEDFNCKRVDWRNYKVREEEGKDRSWNRELFNLATQSLLHQHINEPTRMRGEDRPTILDLLFTRTEEEVTNIQYKTPIGNSDHVVLQFDFLVQYEVEYVKEKYKEDRLNYKKGNYEKLRKLYKETYWKELEEIEGINKQYERFLELIPPLPPSKHF